MIDCTPSRCHAAVCIVGLWISWRLVDGHRAYTAAGMEGVLDEGYASESSAQNEDADRDDVHLVDEAGESQRDDDFHGYASDGEAAVDASANEPAADDRVRDAAIEIAAACVIAKAREDFCASAIASMPAASSSLAMQTVRHLENPRGFSADSDHGLSTMYWVGDYFEAAEPRRASSWLHTCDLVGIKSATKAHIQKIKSTCFEVAELLLLSSHLYCNALAARVRRSFDRRQEDGVCLLLGGEMDEASYKLRLQRKRNMAICDGEKEAKRACVTFQNTSEAKVVYAECHFAVMTRNRSTGQYTVLRGDLPIPLQHIKRTTAENVLECHRQIFDVIPGLAEKSFENCFKHVVRMSCMDKHSANNKATNQLRHLDKDHTDEARSRKRLALFCDIHPTAGCITRAWFLVEDHISGMLALSLAQKVAGRFDEMQEVLGTVCVTMLKIIRS